MTPQRRLEIEQHANLYGSANCWAGTGGTLATMIRELMAEIDRLSAESDALRIQLRLAEFSLRLHEGKVDELDIRTHTELDRHN